MGLELIGWFPTFSKGTYSFPSFLYNVFCLLCFPLYILHHFSLILMRWVHIYSTCFSTSISCYIRMIDNQFCFSLSLVLTMAFIDLCYNCTKVFIQLFDRLFIYLFTFCIKTWSIVGPGVFFLHLQQEHFVMILMNLYTAPYNDARHGQMNWLI